MEQKNKAFIFFFTLAASAQGSLSLTEAYVQCSLFSEWEERLISLKTICRRQLPKLVVLQLFCGRASFWKRSLAMIPAFARGFSPQKPEFPWWRENPWALGFLVDGAANLAPLSSQLDHNVLLTIENQGLNPSTRRRAAGICPPLTSLLYRWKKAEVAEKASLSKLKTHFRQQQSFSWSSSSHSSLGWSRARGSGGGEVGPWGKLAGKVVVEGLSTISRGDCAWEREREIWWWLQEEMAIKSSPTIRREIRC